MTDCLLLCALRCCVYDRMQLAWVCKNLRFLCSWKRPFYPKPINLNFICSVWLLWRLFCTIHLHTVLHLFLFLAFFIICLMFIHLQASIQSYIVKHDWKKDNDRGSQKYFRWVTEQTEGHDESNVWREKSCVAVAQWLKEITRPHCFEYIIEKILTLPPGVK